MAVIINVKIHVSVNNQESSFHYHWFLYSFELLFSVDVWSQSIPTRYLQKEILSIPRDNWLQRASKARTAWTTVGIFIQHPGHVHEKDRHSPVPVHRGQHNPDVFPKVGDITNKKKKKKRKKDNPNKNLEGENWRTHNAGLRRTGAVPFPLTWPRWRKTRRWSGSWSILWGPL